MRIQKDNIVIRSATVEDAIQLNKWWNDGRVMKDVGFPKGTGESLEDTIENIKRREGKLNDLCIIEIDGKPVGELNYNIKGNIAYPGWKICDLNYQNRGYGPKIIMMLFTFLFEDKEINSQCKIEKIVWDTLLENKRAQYVYEKKLGIPKAEVKENAYKDQTGKWRTGVFYELTREEFYMRRKASETCG